MKKSSFIFVLLTTILWDSSVFAQPRKAITVPLSAEKWVFEPGKVEFIKDAGKQTMKILPHQGRVVLKDFVFSSGTIEFDIKPLAPAFASFYFRMQDKNEAECFYFRTGAAGNAAAGDAVQYAPVLASVNLWDMLGHYQTNAAFTRQEWNHVKLVVSGAQMRIYVNSVQQPTLEIDRLEGNTASGTLAFEGESLISNLMVKPGEVEGLAPLPGIDPTRYDPRYIRQWAVSSPSVTPEKVDFSYAWLPTPETTWQVVEAERRGLLNLTRLYGKSDQRRFVWLKSKVVATEPQKKKLDIGFSDEVWVFLNNKLVFTDKNLYGQPMMKTPQGRCSPENTSCELAFQQGTNELLIGVANDFFGWGLIARMENLDGLQITPAPTFDVRIVKLSEKLLDTYVGQYLQPDGKQITLTSKPNALEVSAEGMPPTLMYPEAEDKFFIKDFDLQVEFQKAKDSKISGFILYNSGKQVMDIKRISEGK
jgi:hypothetical protein